MNLSGDKGRTGREIEDGDEDEGEDEDGDEDKDEEEEKASFWDKTTNNPSFSHLLSSSHPPFPRFSNVAAAGEGGDSHGSPHHTFIHSFTHSRQGNPHKHTAPIRQALLSDLYPQPLHLKLLIP